MEYGRLTMLGMPAEDMNIYSSKDSKCPSCGGKLVFDPVGQVLKCGFCGNTYTPEKLELLNLLPEIDKGAAGENEDDKCAIVCDNCGAELIRTPLQHAAHSAALPRSLPGDLQSNSDRITLSRSR